MTCRFCGRCCGIPGVLALMTGISRHQFVDQLVDQDRPTVACGLSLLPSRRRDPDAVRSHLDHHVRHPVENTHDFREVLAKNSRRLRLSAAEPDVLSDCGRQQRPPSAAGTPSGCPPRRHPPAGTLRLPRPGCACRRRSASTRAPGGASRRGPAHGRAPRQHGGDRPGLLQHDDFGQDDRAGSLAAFPGPIRVLKVEVAVLNGEAQLRQGPVIAAPAVSGPAAGRRPSSATG
jgi:hypothetical protein